MLLDCLCLFSLIWMGWISVWFGHEKQVVVFFFLVLVLHSKLPWVEAVRRILFFGGWKAPEASRTWPLFMCYLLAAVNPALQLALASQQALGALALGLSWRQPLPLLPPGEMGRWWCQGRGLEAQNVVRIWRPGWYLQARKAISTLCWVSSWHGVLITSGTWAPICELNCQAVLEQLSLCGFRQGSLPQLRELTHLGADAERFCASWAIPMH